MEVSFLFTQKKTAQLFGVGYDPVIFTELSVLMPVHAPFNVGNMTTTTKVYLTKNSYHLLKL